MKASAGAHQFSLALLTQTFWLQFQTAVSVHSYIHGAFKVKAAVTYLDKFHSSTKYIEHFNTHSCNGQHIEDFGAITPSICIPILSLALV